MLLVNKRLQQPLIILIISLGLIIGAAEKKEILDRDITSAVESELWSSSRINANYIDVETKNGIVSLKGKVKSILYKEKAAEQASAVVGVRSVINSLEVEESDYSDSKIQQEIENAWLTDPTTESYELKAKVKDGHVTITGKVDSIQESIEAENVAKSVVGVRGVTDKTDIAYTMNRLDSEIKNDILSRLKNDVRVDDYLITVKVTDGTVSLNGTVGSLYEKNRAIRDSWVAGVKDVKGEQLDIQWWARDKMIRKEVYTNLKTDKIEKAVKDSFKYDPRVKDKNVEVHVNLGTATLSGVVDNLKAKNAAEDNAMNTVGVYRVENNIKVRPANVPSNTELEEKITSKMVRDPLVESWEVDVNAVFGIVYLKGEVGTWLEKEQAEDIAESTEGVIAVVSNIEYADFWQFKSDQAIRLDAAEEMVWSPFVDRDQVEISVNNGVATLKGEVDTYSERKAAEDNAYEAGAKTVINQLAVKFDYN